MLHCNSLVPNNTNRSTARGPSRNRGVAALAAEIGRTTGAVSASLNRGKTVEQIRETARRTDARRAAGKARGRQAGGLQVAVQVPPSTSTPTSYVPARRAVVGSPRAVLVPEAMVPGETVQVPVQSIDGPSAPFTFSGIPGSVAPVLDDNGIETEGSADRRKAIALANERELTVAQKRKELMPVREVNAWFAGCIVGARNVLLRIGPELRDRLAAETDPVQCEALVDAEVRRALTFMKDMPV